MAGRILIKNGTVVTMNDAGDVLFGGSVVLDGDRIADVGPADEVAARQPNGGQLQVIDAAGKAVLPGLVDLHYHTALGKGWSDHLPLWEYLETCWYPIIRALDDDAAYWAALASYTESIRCGVTTVNDMYRQPRRAGRRRPRRSGSGRCCPTTSPTTSTTWTPWRSTSRRTRSNHGKADGRIEVYVGIEWLPLVSEGLLRDTRALADELGTGIHIHLNESLTEVENSKQRFGRRPTEVAYDCGILGRNTIAAHCVWLSDTEIALMRETGTQISHNPSSNAKLGNGMARVPEMLAAGLNVGLGHDAAECNNSRDLFEVMKFASLVHRATRVDASLQQAPDVVRMATRNGSAALGHETGQLTAGRKADLILVDLRSQMFTPLMPGNADHLFSHLVFAANGSCVDTTIIDGKIVMEGRRIVTVDEPKVLEKANAAFVRVLDKMVVPDISGR